MSGYEATRDVIQKLLDDVLPTLEISTFTTLGEKGKKYVRYIVDYI